MGITIASSRNKEEIEEQFATLLEKAKKGFANVEEKENEFTIVTEDLRIYFNIDKLGNEYHIYQIFS